MQSGRRNNWLVKYIKQIEQIRYKEHQDRALSDVDGVGQIGGIQIIQPRWTGYWLCEGTEFHTAEELSDYLTNRREEVLDGE